MSYTPHFAPSPAIHRQPNNAYVRLSMRPIIATQARLRLSENEALYASTSATPQSVMDCWLVPPTVTAHTLGDYMRSIRKQSGAVYFFTMVREVIQ